MITKHIKGRSFSRCLHYVMGKAGAQVIGGNLFSTTAETARVELEAVAARSQRTQKPLLHCALSLAPGERLSNEQWRCLSREYLQQLGFKQNQYLLIRHTDTPSHEHVHLLVNRVTFAGVSVSNSWDFMRSQVVVRQLSIQYGLKPVPLSWEKRAPDPSRANSNPAAFRRSSAAIALEAPEQGVIAHQFEPDEILPMTHQRYLQLEAWIQQQAEQRCTRRQIDLQIAQWALRSTRPEEARVLVYSPEIQRLRVQQGDAVALDYLKALMEEAQRRAVSSFDVQRQL